MKDNRKVARLLAGIVVVTGVFAGAAAPAQAFDTGWNGTRVAPTSSDTTR